MLLFLEIGIKTPKSLQYQVHPLVYFVESLRQIFSLFQSSRTASTRAESHLSSRSPANLPMPPPLRFWKRHRQHNPQGQSLLFTLPAELRLQIFALVLDCSPIWLTTHEALDGPHLKVNEGGNGTIPRAATVLDSRLLSLLLSCARAHDEAISSLYGLNTFCVRDLRTLRFLACGVGAPYITRLEVWVTSLFHLPLGSSRDSLTRWSRWLGKKQHRERKWAQQWAPIKRLESLRSLFIQLEAPGVIWQETFRPFESMIIKPLEGLLGEGMTGKLRLFWDRPIGHEIAAEEILSEWVVERVEENAELRRVVVELRSRR